MAAGAGEGGGIGNERTHLAKLRVHVTLQEPSFQNKLNLLSSSSPLSSETWLPASKKPGLQKGSEDFADIK